MTSDFAAARTYLERAYRCLRGDDDISKHAREALDILCEAVITVEFHRSSAKVIPFSNQVHKTRSPR